MPGFNICFLTYILFRIIIEQYISKGYMYLSKHIKGYVSDSLISTPPDRTTALQPTLFKMYESAACTDRSRI